MKYFNFFKQLAGEAKPYALSVNKQMNAVAKNIADQMPEPGIKDLMGKGKHYTMKKIPNQDFYRTFFGDIPLTQFNRMLRIGDVYSAFKKSVNKSLNNNEAKSLLTEVVPLPTYKLNILEKRASACKQTGLGKQLDQCKDIRALDELATKNSRLSTWFSGVKGKTLGYAAVTTVGALTFGALVLEHQRKMSRCLRYQYNADGKTKICVVSQHTCATVSNNETTCTDIELDELKPFSTCSQDQTTGCVRCNSSADDPLIEDPTVAYRCVTASFTEAVTDLIGEGAEKIFDVVSGGVTQILMTILKFVLLPLIVLGIIVVGGVYFYKQQKSVDLKQ